MNNVINFFRIFIIAVCIIGCKGNDQKIEVNQTSTDPGSKIINAILCDKDGYYYIDFSNYPANDKTLPVGIFDSGTGGLTVLKAIVNFDQYNNETHKYGSDGLKDFITESFIYLGDLANMPYGNYSAEGNLDLLKEHIIKDAQFLLDHKYYSHAKDTLANTDKQPVKVIVIGCNTATAYGKQYLEDFISMAGIDLEVIGVIDAGAEGALAAMNKDEDAVIGVLATSATVDSKGYFHAIMDIKDKQRYSGNIEVFSQGGVGIAEAVDEDANYIIKNASAPRAGYKGPDLSGDPTIDRTLMAAYNFDFTDEKMLCDAEIFNECSVMQINDAENYLRFHLVTLMEQIRKSNTKSRLKTLILGCTHYPYLADEIEKILEELYDFRTDDGKQVYREFMARNIELVDPGLNTANALYDHLHQKSLINPEGSIKASEFYISVTNQDNPNVIMDSNSRFIYEYKYGRTSGEIQEYVKIVPFNRQNISCDVLSRIHKQMPYVYMLIQNFHENCSKTGRLKELDKI